MLPYVVVMPPPALPALRKVETVHPYVALTFDDGPDARYTPAILRLLERAHAQATFFCVAYQAPAHAALLRRMTRDGDEVASHGYSHRSLLYLEDRRIRQEVFQSAALLRTLSGQEPRHFRPPYGRFDHRILDACRLANERVTLWSKDTRDWSGLPGPVIADRALWDIRPGDILLLHDGGGNRQHTVAAVAILLRELHRRGLVPVTLNRLCRQATTAGAP